MSVSESITACNEAFAPVAERAVAISTAGDDAFNVATAAVAEAKPALRQRISLRAVAAVYLVRAGGKA